MRLILILSFVLCGTCWAAETTNPLATLRKEHPRLLATAKTFSDIPNRAKKDPVYAKILAKVLKDAEGDLLVPPNKFEIPDGKRLLATSRAILARIERLGMAWQVTHDRRFVDRAWVELKSAAEFPNWNPSHFLDTAELCRAFAIGYDWMYDAWTPDQRRILKNTIVEKALNPALDNYTNPKNSRFVRATNNWNQVCNSGIVLGALAVADEEPELSRKLIEGAFASLPRSISLYKEDGSWDEGYGYFHYGASYLVALIAGFESATGSDQGLLKQIPGVERMADFPMNLEGNIGKIFNFADSGEKAGSMPEIGWLATRYNRAQAAIVQRKHAANRPSPLDLIWLPSAEAARTRSAPVRAAQFVANACCSLRTAWNDPKAGYVGFKGGDNRASHGHLDIGTFVYESNGVRWASDLSGDNYNLEGYFGSTRWGYYRLRAEGHNTLSVAQQEGADQEATANCPLILCKESNQGGVAVANLSAAFPKFAEVKRGVRLYPDKSLRVQDELKPDLKISSQQLVWSLHTGAKIEIADDGRSALFTREGEKLRVTLLSPNNARFEAMDAVTIPPRKPREGENPNKGIRKLIVRLDVTSATTVVVDLVPESSKGTRPLLTSLGGW